MRYTRQQVSDSHREFIKMFIEPCVWKKTFVLLPKQCLGGGGTILPFTFAYKGTQKITGPAYQNRKTCTYWLTKNVYLMCLLTDNQEILKNE